MNRAEMLAKLHSIKPGVELTVLQSEEALACEYVTQNGYLSEWIGLHDWPVVRLSSVNPVLLEVIKEKIHGGTLTFQDIDGTPIHALLDKFLSEYSDEDSKNYTDDRVLNALLVSLKNVTISAGDELYAIFDSRAALPSFKFFTDYETMAVYFCEDYKGTDSSWEEMSDDDLEQWLERLEEGYEGVPFYDIGIEEEK